MLVSKDFDMINSSDIYDTNKDHVHVYLKVQRKRSETNMDQIFEHPVFDSAKEKMKRVIRQLEKPQEVFENSL